MTSVDALGEVYAELNARRSAVVRITNPEIDLRTVRVVARHATHSPIEAIRPTGDVTDHVLAGIRPGAWVVQAEAAGYVGQQVNLAVPEEGEPAPLPIALQPAGARMPKLFGANFRDAEAALEEAGIDIGEIYDITGTEFVLEEAKRELGDGRVVVQLPAPDTVVLPGQRVGLVVGAALEAQPSVVMPSLVGMTLEEARRALEALGLIVGRHDRRTTAAVRIPIDRG
ncbi:MAG: PASTA domain-containing protein [Myxococcales bacterium]|nr:PASTA domain-containing protein [Myxococcales bacterium]